MTERDDRPWNLPRVRENEPITGRCERCGWYATADSYPEMVKRYQDHLREAHPSVWLRT